jgi:hypothetical protein
MKRSACCLGLWIIAGIAMADDAEVITTLPAVGEVYTEEVMLPSTDEDDATLWDNTLQWLNTVRDERSEDVGQLGRYIDAMFAGETDAGVPNKTYVQITTQSTVSEIPSRRGTEAGIKLKLDLPNTKRRWKLFFESDNTDADRLDQKVRNVGSGADTEAVGGLRLENDPTDAWRVSTDVGLRARIPLDAFARFKARRDWRLGNPWIMTFEHEDWYFHEKGFGTENSLDFHRPLGESHYLSVTSAAQYQDRYKVIELAQTATVTHFIDERQAIAYGVGVLGVNKPSVKTTAYYVSTNYQRKIYKDWLFMEVTPELLFPRIEDFRSKWSLTLEFKAVLTDW